MEQELYLMNLALIEAQLARWAVQLGNGVMPRGLTLALEDFHRRWMVNLFWVKNPEFLTETLLRLFQQIPEIQSWAARNEMPIALDVLADSITKSVWNDMQIPAMSFWRRWWKETLTSHMRLRLS